MPESRSLSELTRQIAPPTKNGHAPPPTESRKSSQSVNPVRVRAGINQVAATPTAAPRPRRAGARTRAAARPAGEPAPRRNPDRPARPGPSRAAPTRGSGIADEGTAARPAARPAATGRRRRGRGAAGRLAARRGAWGGERRHARGTPLAAAADPGGRPFPRRRGREKPARRPVAGERPAAGEVGPSGAPLAGSERPKPGASPHRAARKAPDVLEEAATRRGGRGPDTEAPFSAGARLALQQAAERQRSLRTGLWATRVRAPSPSGNFRPSFSLSLSLSRLFSLLAAQLQPHRRPALLAAGTPHGRSPDRGRHRHLAWFFQGHLKARGATRPSHSSGRSRRPSPGQREGRHLACDGKRIGKETALPEHRTLPAVASPPQRSLGRRAGPPGALSDATRKATSISRGSAPTATRAPRPRFLGQQRRRPPSPPARRIARSPQQRSAGGAATRPPAAGNGGTGAARGEPGRACEKKCHRPGAATGHRRLSPGLAAVGLPCRKKKSRGTARQKKKAHGGAFATPRASHGGHGARGPQRGGRVTGLNCLPTTDSPASRLALSSQRSSVPRLRAAREKERRPAEEAWRVPPTLRPPQPKATHPARQSRPRPAQAARSSPATTEVGEAPPPRPGPVRGALRRVPGPASSKKEKELGPKILPATRRVPGLRPREGDGFSNAGRAPPPPPRRTDGPKTAPAERAPGLRRRTDESKAGQASKRTNAARPGRGANAGRLLP
ncbi:serine/arginine repetitive matrix protein 1-like [Agelaius tricolor]|uniref:serine/arginine repetitive matrix protein 1-like n=1 Tax=Agelaius tricolor TaxID=9191 RepID=UPI0039F224E0